MSSPQPTALDADLAEDLAYAKRQRAMLDRMAEVGMALIEELGERTINAPYHPEPRHDPARAFAALSRAVRLTVVLQGRVQAEIVALRNGTPAPAAAPPPRATFEVASEPRDDDQAADEPRGDPATEGDARDRLYETLVDREDDEAVRCLRFAAYVAAIRADLGLPPLEGLAQDPAPPGAGLKGAGVGCGDRPPDFENDAGEESDTPDPAPRSAAGLDERTLDAVCPKPSQAGAVSPRLFAPPRPG